MSEAGSHLRFELNYWAALHLTEEFCTPLYVMSEDVFRARIRAYWAAFRASDKNCQLGYAAKANSALSVLRIASNEGLMIDVASDGELEAAIRAGVPVDRCYLHGSNKSDNEIGRAVQVGVNHIVVDNDEDLRAVYRWNREMPIVLRFAPGVDPITHEKIRTGQSDTKFGFPLTDEELDRLGGILIDLGLNYLGVQCHVGSQLLDPRAQMEGGAMIARAASRFQDKFGLKTSLVNVGGGLGVSYTSDDKPLSFEDYNRGLCPPVRAILDEVAPGAVLMQEPGRSLVADAGVTLYSVGRIKRVEAEFGPQTYVSVDGGLADNPRPALYGAQYTLRALKEEPCVETAVYTVSGRHCETDTLFKDIELPVDLAKGDLLQVMTTGAYNASMASNYNRYPRPAMVLVRADGRAQIIQERETYEEMFAREVVLDDLK